MSLIGLSEVRAFMISVIWRFLILDISLKLPTVVRAEPLATRKQKVANYILNENWQAVLVKMFCLECPF